MLAGHRKDTNMNAPHTPKRIVVTGTNRGLGLAFTRLWLDAGARVCALSRRAGEAKALVALARRHPDTLRCIGCDVSDDRSVETAAAEVLSAWDGVDILVNNAGVFGPRDSSLESLDFSAIRKVFEVNTLGPLRVTRSLLPLLRTGVSPRVANVTSLMGSIEDNTSGGFWPYRLSKAALNMATRNLAHDLGEADIPVVVIHPGWVRTDMGGPAAPLEIDDAVSSMIRTIESLTPEHAGGFFDRNGERMPW